MSIPTYLEHQPVIEASFELRFNKEIQISEIIPGYLFHSLDCKKPITNLPASQIPKNVRDSDENLHFALVHRLEWKNYLIGISDHGIVISTKENYKGWTDFKDTILTVINALSKLNINDRIERIGIKYVDFFEMKSKKDCQFDKLNIEFRLANEDLGANRLTMRLERIGDEYDTVIQVISHAVVMSENGQFNKNGLVLDIDTIKNLNVNSDVALFISDTDNQLNKIHAYNKSTFFSCLKQSTIDALGPVYNKPQ